MNNEIIKELEKNIDDIIKWRRHLHEFLELSFQEFETSNYIYELLKTFGNLNIAVNNK